MEVEDNATVQQNPLARLMLALTLALVYICSLPSIVWREHSKLGNMGGSNLHDIEDLAKRRKYRFVFHVVGSFLKLDRHSTGTLEGCIGCKRNV